MKLQLKGEVTVGNVVTTLSVLVSVVALLISWSQDRSLMRHEQANEVRGAAAQTIAKLERWREIALSLFWDIQPSLVKTSEMLVTDRGRDSLEKARDYLYRQIQVSQLTTKKRIVDEEVETAYVYLYSFHPTMRDRFEETMGTLRRLEEEAYAHLLMETQVQVQRYSDPIVAKEDYETATLGNALRMAALRVKKSYEQKMDKALMPMEKFLSEIVRKSDRELVDSKRWME